MRVLKQNKYRKLYYALYEKDEEVLEDGKHTGRYEPVYSDPVGIKANVADSTSIYELRAFGTYPNCEMVAVIDEKGIPFDENTVFWYGVPTTQPHNYIVVKVVRSIFSVKIGLKRVETK